MIFISSFAERCLQVLILNSVSITDAILTQSGFCLQLPALTAVQRQLWWQNTKAWHLLPVYKLSFAVIKGRRRRSCLSAQMHCTHTPLPGTIPEKPALSTHLHESLRRTLTDVPADTMQTD